MDKRTVSEGGVTDMRWTACHCYY